MKAKIRLKSYLGATVLKMLMSTQLIARPNRIVKTVRLDIRSGPHHADKHMQAVHATWTSTPIRIHSMPRHVPVTRWAIIPRLRSQYDMEISEHNLTRNINVELERIFWISVQAVATVGCGSLMLLLTATWQPAIASSQEVALAESR